MPFDLQPELTGDLVALRPLREADYDALYTVARDPLIWEQHPASNRHQPDVFREFFRDAIAFRWVDTAIFLVGPLNVRSQRAVERLGGVRAGMRNDAHGRESVVYELTPAAYAAAPTR